MKKICKVFGVLLAFAMVVGLSSCDSLWKMYLPDEEDDNTVQTTDDTNETPMEYVTVDTPINHEFYLSDDKSSYIYYTSTTRFIYENHDDCIYQISFTPTKSDASQGKWKLYTRERATVKTIDMIHQGTFKGVNGGSIKTGGTVQLLIDNQVIQTIEISKKTVQLASGSKEAYACQINVAAAHKAINATDAK